jgi:hypothetical protein
LKKKLIQQIKDTEVGAEVADKSKMICQVTMAFVVTVINIIP